MGPKNRMEISIDKGRRGCIFTNNEVISGEIRLTVPDSLTVSSIVVSLEGTSTAAVEFSSGSGDNRRVETVRNIHTQVYNALVVFPPPDQSQNLSSQKFTLAAGEYCFPFSFLLPMVNACGEDTFGLPPDMLKFSTQERAIRGDIVKELDVPKYCKTCPKYYTETNNHTRKKFDLDGRKSWTACYGARNERSSSHLSGPMAPTLKIPRGEVQYSIKSKIIKPALFLFNMKDTKIFYFLPSDLPQPESQFHIIHRQNITIPKHIDIANTLPEMFLELQRDPSRVLLPGGDQIFLLHIIHNQPNAKCLLPDLFLDSIKVDIITITDFRAISKPTMHIRQETKNTTLKEARLNMRRLNLSKLLWHKDGDFMKTQVPADIYSFKFPLGFIPSFETCNLTRVYFIEVTLAYAFDLNAKGGIFRRLLLKRIRKACIRTNEMLVGSGIPLVNSKQNPDFEALRDKNTGKESKIQTHIDIQTELLPQYERNVSM